MTKASSTRQKIPTAGLVGASAEVRAIINGMNERRLGRLLHRANSIGPSIELYVGSPLLSRACV
jgi:hypothetical protein